MDAISAVGGRSAPGHRATGGLRAEAVLENGETPISSCRPEIALQGGRVGGSSSASLMETCAPVCRLV